MRQRMFYLIGPLTLTLFCASSFQTRIEASQDGDGETILISLNTPQRGSILAPTTGDCLLSPTQYSFTLPSDDPCGLITLGITARVRGNQNLDLYMRLGQRVTVEGDRIVADYSSTSPDGDEDVFMHVGTSPPIRAGAYIVDQLMVFKPRNQD
jgi:hypothetical protein